MKLEKGKFWDLEIEKWDGVQVYLKLEKGKFWDLEIEKCDGGKAEHVKPWPDRA